MAAQVLKRVFSHPRYAALALATAAAVFIFATWLPNLGLVWVVGTSASVPLAAKIKILFALAGSIGTNFTLFSALSLIALALLFGANIALLAYSVDLQRQIEGHLPQSGAATSLGGIVSGLLGVGCAACGTFALAPVLSLIGAGGFLATLPFGGQEFSVLGIGLLSLSLVLTGKWLARPPACPVLSQTRPRKL